MLATTFKVHVYAQHYKVTFTTPAARQFCINFSHNFVAYKLAKEAGRFRKVMDKVYAAANQTRTYYRFHIGSLDQFKDALKASGLDVSTEWVFPTRNPPAPVSFTVKEGWAPRDGQQPFIDFFLLENPVNKLLPLQTGGGKTFCALYSAAQIGQRMAIVVRAMFIDKWVKDVLTILNIDKKKVCVVKGASALKSVLTMAKDGELEYDIIIFSIDTVSSWFKDYEAYGDEIVKLGYSCTPETWLSDMNIGVKLVDEVHLHFHAMFKLDLYSDVPRSIALSATLIDKDPFMMRMYSTMFPPHCRAQVPVLKRYARAVALHYTFRTPEYIRTFEHGSSQYSHGAMEKSIMKHRPTLNNYLKMIEQQVDKFYIQHPRKNKKLAVFAATKAMCNLITLHLKAKYKQLDVRRYVDEDPYENAIDPHIRVTTIGSLGTGIDIPDLVTVIMTVAISSIKANIQTLGRLREIVGDDVYFVFFTADNIPKHVDYYNEKIKLLAERAASTKDVNAGLII